MGKIRDHAMEKRYALIFRLSVCVYTRPTKRTSKRQQQQRGSNDVRYIVAAFESTWERVTSSSTVAMPSFVPHRIVVKQSIVAFECRFAGQASCPRRFCTYSSRQHLVSIAGNVRRHDLPSNGPVYDCSYYYYYYCHDEQRYPK